MTDDEKKKILAELKNEEEILTARQNILNFKSNFARARSVTVGTAFGGVTELTLRGDGGTFLHAIMQPAEVIELIHQLSANVGCHIALKPRDDFSSWREWRVSENEKKFINGHPPHPNDMALFNSMGTVGFDQEKVENIIENKLLQGTLNQKNKVIESQKKKVIKNGDTMATKKIVNRGSPKPTSKTT